jgi:hypothetical protein
VTSPYTTQPVEALLAAQTAVGFVLGAILWHQRMRPPLAAFLLLLAIAAAVVAPVDGDFWHGIGLTVSANHTKHVLKLGLVLAVIAVVLTRRPLASVLALLGAGGLWKLTSYIQESDAWLAALHLCFLGAIVGAYWRPSSLAPQARTSPATPLHRAWVDDVFFLVAGTIAGAVVATVLLHRWTNSGDEWADTYQAAVFAKLRAYGEVPRCSEAFRSFWVFQFSGRSFAQYTPGWPLFMAPFMWISAPWLAGPVSLGLLGAATCRLGRRAASASGAVAASSTEVRAAGRFAASAVLLGASMLINGGSRYPHIFVAATFAWSVEALCAICWPHSGDRKQALWGAVLGLSSALLLAARPSDGATLGIGLACYFVYSAVRRRVDWRAALAAIVAFCIVGGVTLLILRAQLGRWFTTGYSLTASLYPWFATKWSVPKATEYRFGVPLDTGSYCWWPCSPAVGIAGLMLLRGRSRSLFFVFAAGYVPFLVFYTLLEFGRGWDLGYGPRFTLPAVLPMAVGTGVAFARLWITARSRHSSVPALRLGGPVAVALACAALGIVRVAPLLYPVTYTEVQNHNRLHEAIDQAHLHDAIVLAGYGFNNTDPKDLPENLPFELYPDQDVLIANETEGEVVECLRERYPTRRLYRALPTNPVAISAY